MKTYSRAILSAPPYAMNDEFSRILSQEMERYSNDPNADRLNRLKGEMSQVRYAYRKFFPSSVFSVSLWVF